MDKSSHVINQQDQVLHREIPFGPVHMGMLHLSLSGLSFGRFSPISGAIKYPHISHLPCNYLIELAVIS